MCIALFTLDHPEYALILCSNRDEYLARPTEPARFHTFGGRTQGRRPTVLSGIDVQAGGTWLGLSRSGRLGLLTNITEPLGEYASSRGHLVASFVTLPSYPSSRSLEDEVRELIPQDACYAGFNLLLLLPAATNTTTNTTTTSTTTTTPPPSTTISFDALFVTNRGAGGPITYRALTDAQRHRGGLSNGIDGAGADEWPKIRHGVRALDDLLVGLPPNTSDDELADRLFDLLTWRSFRPPRDRSELKNTIQVEPVNFPEGVYGTRLSTVVLVKRSGDVYLAERDRWELSAKGQQPILADETRSQQHARVFRFGLEMLTERSEQGAAAAQR